MPRYFPYEQSFKSDSSAKETPDFFVQYGSRQVEVYIEQLEEEGLRISLQDVPEPIGLLLPVQLPPANRQELPGRWEYLHQLTLLQEEVQKIASFLFSFFTERATYLGLYRQVERQLEEEKLQILPDFSRERTAEKERLTRALEREKQLFSAKIAPFLAAKNIEPGILLNQLLQSMRSHPTDRSIKARRRKKASTITRTTWVG